MSLKAAPSQNPQTPLQKANSASMFETFHQTPHGEFRTSFYNPYEVKHRKRTTRTQFSILENAFQENPKPNSSIRKELAQRLNMTPRGVQVWFQNRRAKAKSRQITNQGRSSESSGDKGQDGVMFSINSTDSNSFTQNQLLFESSVSLQNNGVVNPSDDDFITDNTKQDPLPESKHKFLSGNAAVTQRPGTKRATSLGLNPSEEMCNLGVDYHQAQTIKRNYSFEVPSIHISEPKSAASPAFLYRDISSNFMTIGNPVADMNGLHSYAPFCSVADTTSNGQLGSTTDGNFQQLLLQNTLTTPLANTRRNSYPPESFDNISFSTSNPQLGTVAENEGLFIDHRGNSASTFDVDIKFQADHFPHLMETPISAEETNLSHSLPLIPDNSEGNVLVDPALSKIHKPGRLNSRTHSEPIIHTPFTSDLPSQLDMEMESEFNLHANDFTHTQASNSNLYHNIDLSATCLGGPLPIAAESIKTKGKVPHKNSKISERLNFFNFDLNHTSPRNSAAPAVTRSTPDSCIDTLQDSIYFPTAQEYTA